MTTLNSDLKLLDDQDIQRFIMDGMLSFHPDVSSETHEEIHNLLSNCSENESPLGNNVLSRIPQMHEVLRSKEVDGAITSILGKTTYFTLIEQFTEVHLLPQIHLHLTLLQTSISLEKIQQQHLFGIKMHKVQQQEQGITYQSTSLDSIFRMM